ncbi:hypothetical protein C2G38_2170398 [Gigaspora rosea]|uniref:Uncharacterized protein n=1 Tax=Gigaspora rosea TaxID=44941 RepID=A0A397VRU0_9GLOM|nr:hypothetical protein C2G38_2170398 [Gigaspora rosea]
MTIPILWQDPFSFNIDSFIPKYFSSLGEDETFILKECGIDVEFPKQYLNMQAVPRYMNWIYFSDFLELNPEIFYSLGQNEKFFARLHHLSLDVISDFNIKNLAALLMVLAKIAMKINTLYLEEFLS